MTDAQTHAEDQLDADVAVLGGGTAGAVVAGRLAQRTGASVVLVEAGPDYGALTTGAWPADLLDSLRLPESHDWGYAGDAPSPGRTLPFERARVIGGCSAHNGCSQTVGHSADYDGWHLPGVDAAALRPRFATAAAQLRVEAQADATLTPFQRGALEAMTAAGIARVDDFLDLDGGAGCGPVPVNAPEGVRFNGAFAYLDPIRRSGRLRVVDHAVVDRLTFAAGASSRALAARVLRRGAPLTIRADRFVLAGGTYGSPAMLLRSGVGPAADLRALGIAAVADLPGVGHNLHDHPTLELRFAGSEVLATNTAAFAAAGHPVPEEQVIAKVHSGFDPAPYDLHLFPWAAQERGGWVCHLPVGALAPRSRGVLRLRSAAPDEAPDIDHAYLSDPGDLAALRSGIDHWRRLIDEPALGRLLGPPLDAVSRGADDQRALRDAVAHYWHPVGTCAMGADPDGGAVVDARGRVHGLDNVWVVDGSVLPSVPRATTNLPIVALSELLTEGLIQAT